MFVVSLAYKTDFSEVEKYIDAHLLYLKKYYDQGKFVSSGRKEPRTGADAKSFLADYGLLNWDKEKWRYKVNPNSSKYFNYYIVIRKHNWINGIYGN